MPSRQARPPILWTQHQVPSALWSSISFGHWDRTPDPCGLRLPHFEANLSLGFLGPWFNANHHDSNDSSTSLRFFKCAMEPFELWAKLFFSRGQWPNTEILWALYFQCLWWSMLLDSRDYLLCMPQIAQRIKSDIWTLSSSPAFRCNSDAGAVVKVLEVTAEESRGQEGCSGFWASSSS